MDKNYIGIFVKTAVIGAAFLIINLLVYQIPDLKEATAGFVYPLPVVYLLFLILSLMILAVLIAVSKKNAGQIGYAFLGLTTLKMAVSYVFVRPILAHSAENPTEKVNFFVIFILFLAIEAYYTARLLNNKQ
jgi:hypothetical protein